MDGPPPTSHRERRQRGVRADGTVHEPIMVADGGARRLHYGEQSNGNTPPTKTSCNQKDSPGTSGSRGYARSVSKLVVATYAQGHNESSGRVS